MKFLIVVSCLLGAAFAKPGGVVAPVAYSVGVPSGFSYSFSQYNAPLAYSAVVPAAYSGLAVAPVAHSAVAVAAPVAHSVVAPVAVEKTQYHAQDELGQAAYGHAEAFQTHNAIQDVAGNKIGSYSYIAPNGQVFATKYVADALGYRVASNAVPVGPAAPQADTVEVVAARQAHLDEVEKVKSRSKRSVVAYNVPLAYNHAVVPHVARVAPHVVPTPAHFAYRLY